MRTVMTYIADEADVIELGPRVALSLAWYEGLRHMVFLAYASNAAMWGDPRPH